MNFKVISAIFRRNFISYFSNPTGYVFICVFVLLSGFATFWPNEFFNANLANLDQLNRYLPLILLVFIPAITMSIWADEKRQGTDELLLTLPAADLDIVLGKFLAAVAIYSVALLFSLTNVVVLSLLGVPDFGLIVGSYIGYWLVGVAMLSIGMAASFLTGNLTIGFILGAVFNAPLVFINSADVLFGAKYSPYVKQWSLAEQFRDFGRGVVSMSSIVYFLAIVLVMLYVSIVLIGRRHWRGGRDGESLQWHYLARAASLAAIAVALTALVARSNSRVDVTMAGLSSLSPQTAKLLRDIPDGRTVKVEAFISPEVPESYVRTRLDLLAMLREFEARSRGRVQVTIYDTEQYSKAAQHAEQTYGIRGQQVTTRTGGAMSIADIYLGVAFTSGLDKVVVPFFDRGVPVEYELIRSIATVSGEKRKRVGILQTDAKLFAEFDPQSMQPGRNELIVEELEKQYEVTQINADNPLAEKFDVLLAVQPSSLTEPQMQNFVAAVTAGQPTAIFEDPFPYLDPSVAGTAAPRRPRGGMGMFGMNQPPQQPKGNIDGLWQHLGVDFFDSKVVWQAYNPYPKIRQFPDEFVFVDRGADDASRFEPFSARDSISSDLQQMLFLFPGAVRQRNASKLEFSPLVRTGDKTGWVDASQILEQTFMGPGGLNPTRQLHPTHDEYILAAHIKGKVKPVPPSAPGDPHAGLSLENMPNIPQNLPLAGDAAAPETNAVAQAEPAAPKPNDTAEPPAPAAEPPAPAAEPPATEPSATTEPPAAPDATEPTAPSAPAEPAAEPAANPAEPAAEPAAATPAAAAATAEGATKATSPAPAPPPLPSEADLNVVLVSDIDLLYSAFFALKARGDDPDAEVQLDVDNVAFVLNTLDTLAGDTRFIDIRKRRPEHRSLTRLESWTAAARDDATAARDKLIKEFDAAREKAQQEVDKKVDAIEKDESLTKLQKMQASEMVRRTEEDRLQRQLDVLKGERDQKIKDSETTLVNKVRSVQNACKVVAVALPPLLPLALAAVVLVRRRRQETEGAEKSRLR
ncbi:MAG: Gldg family protein [Pirellulales bacterium]|nr:Gldg family protein [Pirellulales bacterium]